MSEIGVLLVDDEPLIRAGLRMVLDGANQLRILGEAGNGREAVDLVGRLRPDVVLMDIRMPGCDGIEGTRLVRDLPDPPQVVVLTAFETDEFVLRALAAGACGFLLKHTPPPELVAATQQAATGTMSFSPSVLRTLVATATRQAERVVRPDPLAALSSRETEIAERVAEGLTNQEIAEDLFLSVPTVKTHLARIFEKLAVTNRVQLALAVYRSRNG